MLLLVGKYRGCLISNNDLIMSFLFKYLIYFSAQYAHILFTFNLVSFTIWLSFSNIRLQFLGWKHWWGGWFHVDFFMVTRSCISQFLLDKNNTYLWCDKCCVAKTEECCFSDLAYHLFFWSKILFLSLLLPWRPNRLFYMVVVVLQVLGTCNDGSDCLETHLRIISRSSTMRM